MTNICKIIPALAVAVLLTACASSPEAPPAAEQIVEERAQARWAAIIDGKPEDAYEFYSPGFRQSNPPDAFIREQRNAQLRFIFAEIQEVNCLGEDRCIVRVRARYRLVGGPPEMRHMRPYSTVNETWLNIDGQWWFVQN